MDTETATVIIIDDEESVRDTFEALLRKENYRIIKCATSEEGLAKVKETMPDVILLDLMMPGMNGFELAKILKNDDKYRHIPIILITGLASKENLAKGLEAGADDFLGKPVHGIELKARIKSMLRIKRQYDELEDTNVLIEDMMHMIVHDMRNPLTSILLNTFLIQSNKETPDNVKKNVEKIEKLSNRLKNFMDDILMSAKIKSGKLNLNYSDINLNNLIEELKETYVMIANQKRLNFKVEISENVDGKVIKVDKNLFIRLLDNLISNAVKYSSAGGDIELIINYGCDSPMGVEIIVKDSGIGIPEEYHEKVFEKFEVASLKKQGVVQVGIGLSFCKMIVEAHGGTIEVSNNEPKGTVFTIRL